MGKPVEALKNHGGQGAFRVHFAWAHHKQPLVNLSVILPSNFWLKASGLKDIFLVQPQQFLCGSLGEHHAQNLIFSPAPQ